MIYTNTLITDIEKDLIPLGYKEKVTWVDDTSKICKKRIACSLYDVFKDCENLKNKEYLNVTDLKNNLSENLSLKGKMDYEVNFYIDYLFVPYTKLLYTTTYLEFKNFDLVKDILYDGILEDEKYLKYIYNFAICRIYEIYKMKNEIIPYQKPYNYITFKLKWGNCSEKVSTTYTIKDDISGRFIPVAVAKRNIIVTLKKDIEKSYDMIKRGDKVDNNILLELKKKYIDFLNIDSEEVERNSNGIKNEEYEKLCELLDINELDKEYLNKLNVFEDLVKTEVSQKNIVLADTLNTIQIASIVLTIVGWVLVILQHDLPSRVPIYILAIILCSFLSVMIAFFIKKIIDKK